MTLRAALRRLQDLEFKHGDMPLKMQFISARPEGEGDIVETEHSPVFDVIEGECIVMPQSYWETIADLSPSYDQV